MLAHKTPDSGHSNEGWHSMKSLRTLSLKYKFNIIIVCFTVLLTVTFGIIVSDRLSQELWNQFDARGKDVLDALSSRFQESLEERLNDESGVDQLISKLALAGDVGETIGEISDTFLQDELLYAQVVFESQSLYQSNPSINNSFFLIEPFNKVYEKRDLTLPNGERVVDFKQSFSCANIEEMGSNVLCGINYLRLGISPNQVNQELQRALILFTLISAAFIAVGLVVAFILYKWVLGPVDVLTDSVKQFRRDRFARANVHSGDELETLAYEFNKMASTISQHEGHLEQVNDKLTKANQVKSEFLAVMGHELKTPLHAIRGFSQLLLQGVDGPITDEQRHDLKAILSSGDHLLVLIDNILRFSKLESGEEPLHLERIDVHQMSKDAIKTVESLVRNSDLELINKTDSLTVEADATKLKQILINLLSNAIKYAPSGTVKLLAEVSPDDPDMIRFGVSDTGPGIDPSETDKVFEPFRQLDGSTTRESSGIGLGLAIVKKYIEMHDGKVWFEPNPVGGTIFYFTLPLAQKHTPELVNGRAHLSTQR